MPAPATPADPVTDAPHLVHGVFWDGQPAPESGHDGGAPVLRLQSPDGAFTQLPLHAGARLGFRIEETGRSCLGHIRVHSSTRRDHVLCTAGTAAAKGKQCERCFMLDEARLMHDFHRGGRVTPGVRDYLMQEHWLYVATFAGGTTKVGTASRPRKWNRLAEQGAAVARYVAHAADGRVVRILEDLVTADAGLTQRVRSAAKTEALLRPLPSNELDAINARAAANARALLAGTAVEGFAAVGERWERPAQAGRLYSSTARHGYPHPLDRGRHGFGITALSGPNALVRLDGADAEFVVNLGQLSGRTVVLGGFASEVPAVQESLF